MEERKRATGAAPMETCRKDNDYQRNAQGSNLKKLIAGEFEKSQLHADIPEDVIEAINNSRLDLSQNIPDPQMLVSKGNLPVCTRGNFSFVIGLPGARKSFLCSGIAGAFLNDNGCMGLDNPNGTGKLLWIDTEQAPGHVAKIGRRLHRIAELPTNTNSENIIIHMLREYQPPMRHKIFDACMKLYHPDFVVLDGVSDLITDPNSSEQSTLIINDLMKSTKEYDCHILTVIHANVGSEKARGHLGSEALRKCETAIFAEAKGDVTLCRWAKTRDMRPEDFAFMIMEGLPIETDYTATEAKTDKLQQALFSVLPQYPGTMAYSDLHRKLMAQLNVKESAAEKNIRKAVEKGYIIKNQVGCYHLPKVEKNNEMLPF